MEVWKGTSLSHPHPPRRGDDLRTDRINGRPNTALRLNGQDWCFASLKETQ